MSRRVNLVILLGLVIVVVLSFGVSAGARPGEEGAGGDDAGPPEAEFNENLSRLERLQNEAEEANGAYRNALDEERRLNGEIAETRSALTETEGRLAEAEERLEGRARDVYKHSGNPWLKALGQAEDPREFMDAFGLLVRQLVYDRNEVQELREARDTLERTERDLESSVEEREGILEEATFMKDETQQALNDAHEFFDALDQEEREKIEEERVRRAQEAAEMVLETPALQQEPEVQEELEKGPPVKKGPAGDGQERRILEVTPVQVTPIQEQRSTEEPAGELTEEENQDRQAKVAWAISETIRELAGQAEPPVREPNETAKEEEPRNLVAEMAADTAKKQEEADRQAKEAEPRNLVAEMAADTAKKQEEADRQAKEAAEQVVAEKKAKEKAAEQAEAAKKAELAVRLTPTEEQQKAQTAAEEARRQADLAAKEADAMKATTTKAADQATAQREAAGRAATQLAAERTATQPTAGGLPLIPTSATPGAPGTLGTPSATPGATAGTPGAAGTPSAVGAPGSRPAPSGSGGGVVGEAKNYLGAPYVPGGLDCSGFTKAVYSKFGVILPDSPAGQWGTGRPVQGPPAAGDLVFFSEDGSGAPTHVGIANGDGTLTHSSIFTGDVTVTPIGNIPGYMGAKRIT